MPVITRDIQIEDLIELYSGAVGILIKNGLPCVVCGEPFWGTLAELAENKGWNEDQIQALVKELNSSL